MICRLITRDLYAFWKQLWTFDLREIFNNRQLSRTGLKVMIVKSRDQMMRPCHRFDGIMGNLKNLPLVHSLLSIC